MEREDEKLTRLLAEQGKLEKSLEDALQTKAGAAGSLFELDSVEGGDLRSLSAYITGVNGQIAMLRVGIEDSRKLVANQRASCLEARRNYRLVETPKRKRREEWSREVERELEAFAAEAFLARKRFK